MAPHRNTITSHAFTCIPATVIMSVSPSIGSSGIGGFRDHAGHCRIHGSRVHREHPVPCAMRSHRAFLLGVYPASAASSCPSHVFPCLPLSEPRRLALRGSDCLVFCSGDFQLVRLRTVRVDAFHVVHRDGVGLLPYGLFPGLLTLSDVIVSVSLVLCHD